MGEFSIGGLAQEIMATSGYHSDWNKDDVQTVCGMGMCPIKTKFKGPSPQLTDASRPDIIDEALQKLGGCDLDSAKREMYTLSITDFWVPGHANWPLAGFTSKPASRGEQDQVRAWLAQLRHECGVRLCDLVFERDPKAPSKWWTCFRSKKCMNKTLYGE